MRDIEHKIPLLVIDDEEDIRLSLCDFLELEGFETITASNGSDALTKLESCTPSIIISDIMMPEINGLELLAELQKRKIHIPVVIMTAYGTVERAIEAMKNGASDFVTKPLDLDYLLQVLNRVLERKSMEEQIQLRKQQLIQTDKMASLGQLVAGLCHEINNPVNFIKSNIQPLKEDIQDLFSFVKIIVDNQQKIPEDVLKKINLPQKMKEIDYDLDDIKKILDSFDEGSNRIASILYNLRLYSKVDDDYYSSFNIQEAIDSSLTLLYPLYKDQINIHKEYKSFPLTRCSPGQINQVFFNILKNAIEFNQSGGDIWVLTGYQDNNITITIRDNGVGIPKENLSKIFDPFFTTKPVGSGTGLGLSLSYSIIEQHEGRIAVESEMGKGSKFIVSLPIKSN